MDALLRAAVTLSVLATDGRDALARRLADRDDRGQGTIEYVGMIIVASLIVIALLQTNMGSSIASKFTSKINDVLNFGV